MPFFINTRIKKAEQRFHADRIYTEWFGDDKKNSIQKYACNIEWPLHTLNLGHIRFLAYVKSSQGQKTLRTSSVLAKAAMSFVTCNVSVGFSPTKKVSICFIVEGIMSKTKPISLWDATSRERDYQAPLDITSENVDVAIIGGGFTGLSTLLHAVNAGLSAHVLEAENIGFGGSGRNVGLVNAGTWLPPQEVLKVLGESYGHRFVKTLSDGPSFVFNLIEKYQIRCEVTKTGTIHAANSPKGFRDLRRRHAEWLRLGEPVDLLDRAEIQDLIGSSAFHGGLFDHRAGTINPMGYCRGLARAALGAGGKFLRACARNVSVVRTICGSWKRTKVLCGQNLWSWAQMPIRTLYGQD